MTASPKSTNDLLSALDRADVLASDVPELERELADAGVDLSRLDARLARLTHDPRRSTAADRARFPAWVRDWAVTHAAASGLAESELWLEFGDTHLGGSLRLKLEPRQSVSGEGALVVTWEAGFYSPGGWRLELFLRHDDEPAFSRTLGTPPRGQLRLAASELGFDPLTTGFRCSLRPA